MSQLHNQLIEAFPSLTAGDFAYHATDLYVVDYPEVRQWLKANYKFYTNIQTFTSQAGSGWNGAGKRCLDIPFAGRWPS